MPTPISTEQLDRLLIGARRLARQAAANQLDVQLLLTTARTDLRTGQTDLVGAANASELSDSKAPIEAWSHALRNQLTRSTASIELARRLCVSAREHQLAAERLIADLGDGERSDGQSPDSRNAVLVVDDYADSRELLSMVLQNAGFVVRTASNGLEAVLAAYELRPAVIVMDMMMPVLDGMEATRLIKAIDELRDASVIAYTAQSSLTELQADQKLDHLFSTVLAKPSPPELVVATVQRYASQLALPSDDDA